MRGYTEPCVTVSAERPWAERILRHQPEPRAITQRAEQTARARTWSALVENAYRLQEVGYDPEPEADARSDASWARHPVCSP